MIHNNGYMAQLSGAPNYAGIMYSLVNIIRGSMPLSTPLNSEIICVQNVGTKVVCGIILFN